MKPKTNLELAKTSASVVAIKVARMRSKFEFDDSWLSTNTVDDRRAEAIRVEEERVAERRRELESQGEQGSSAEERIKIWERLHALRLPKVSIHPLLAVIAEQTHLSLMQVAEEQQRRRCLGA
jgi:hypothetical protein